jgi:GNAT superfamily N-acetyltransferase
VGAVELAEADVPRAARLIARAFDADPLLCHMLPDARERARLGPVHIEPVVRMCARHGSAWRTEAFDAVAAWMTPEGWPPDPALVEDCGFDEARTAIGARAMARFDQLYGLADGLQERLAPDPHWLLNLVGTDAARRRRGAASAVLAPVLARARAQSTPCYLETFAERNLRFYAGQGFEVAAQARDPDTGVGCWAMLRP